MVTWNGLLRLGIWSSQVTLSATLSRYLQKWYLWPYLHICVGSWQMSTLVNIVYFIHHCLSSKRLTEVLLSSQVCNTGVLACICVVLVQLFRSKGAQTHRKYLIGLWRTSARILLYQKDEEVESYRAKFSGSQADRAAAALESLSVSSTTTGIASL